MSASDIVLTESIGGVAVTKRLPVSDFVGVIANEIDEGAHSLISLVRADGLAIPVEMSPRSDAIAAWRSACRRFSLPMVAEHAGGLIALELMIGGVLRGAANPGRRGMALTMHRRPRFLTRRKTACLPLNPIVHRASHAVRATWLTGGRTFSVTGEEMPHIC
ncbi:MAG: DUF6101 family protein [Beijerinckiaceae bacterium]